MINCIISWAHALQLYWHGCCPVNLLHIVRAPFPKNTLGRLLLYVHIHVKKEISVTDVSYGPE